MVFLLAIFRQQVAIEKMLSYLSKVRDCVFIWLVLSSIDLLKLVCSKHDPSGQATFSPNIEARYPEHQPMKEEDRQAAARLSCVYQELKNGIRKSGIQAQVGDIVGCSHWC